MNLEYEYSFAYQPEEYIKRIRRIKDIDVVAKQKINDFDNAKTIEDSIEIIRSLFYIMFIIPFNFSHKMDLFRVRGTDEFVLHNDLQSLTYRQKDQEGIPIGRANDYGEPILYAGTTQVTALVETRLKQGNYFNYLHFTKKPTSTWLVSTIGDISNYINEGRFHLNVNEIEKVMENLLSQLNENEIEAIKIVDEFLYNFFKKRIDDKSDYKLTNSIASLFLSSTKLDGIVYESVQHAANPPTYNIAIKPSSFEQNYIIKNIQAGIIFDDRDSKSFDIGLYAYGKTSEKNINHIKWSVNDGAEEFIRYESEYSHVKEVYDNY